MAYCPNCGINLDTNSNFCPNCGVALSDIAAQQVNNQQQGNNRQWSDTAKTVGTVAGVAAGASILSRLMHRRRRRPPMPFHGGPMGGHRGHGPMGGPGGHRGHGPMGGPGGHR